MVGTKYNSMLSTRNLTLSDLKYLVLVALLQSGLWDVSLLVVLVEEIVGQEEEKLPAHSLVTVHVTCKISKSFCPADPRKDFYQSI